ncbi:MAG: 16S rRNA (cytosine(1402)-N(4))-methyltransferase RsmH [bacterium]
MHLSVMLQESIDALAVKQGGCYIDGTLGSAGHSAEILKRAGATGRLLGIDRDPEALARSRTRLSEIPGTVCLSHGAHGDLLRIAKANGFESVDGILLDLGVSSDQLDTPERGFSFRFDGPLDMRMDPTRGESAADVIAQAGEQELGTIFWTLGEEQQSRRIAKAIVHERERGAITTTAQLAELVSKAVGGKKGPRHPATKVFQALRMRVNREIEDLEQALEDGINLLKPEGRFAVITFESLTDRVVKHTFAAHVGKWRSLQQGGEEWIGTLPVAEWAVRHAVLPSDEEMELNPRARSAKLRVILRKENQNF